MTVQNQITEENLLARTRRRLLQISTDDTPLTPEQEDRAYIILALDIREWTHFQNRYAAISTLARTLPSTFLPVINDILHDYS